MLLAVLLLFGNQHWAFFSKVRSFTASLVAPLQYGVSWPVQLLGWVGSNVATQQQLLADNAKLSAELLLLRGELQKLTTIERENAALRGLITTYSGKEKKFLVGQLLSVVASNVDQQIILDKGSKDEVYIGQPVVDAYGVMGQVILVAANISRVMLLTDAKSAIPVQVSRNGERSIAIGLGYSNTLELLNVAETTDIKLGDLLVTSGLGGVFPQGYPVGVVSDIKHIVGGKFVRVTVTPNAHLNQSRQVLFIWPHIHS